MAMKYRMSVDRGRAAGRTACWSLCRGSARVFELRRGSFSPESSLPSVSTALDVFKELDIESI